MEILIRANYPNYAMLRRYALEGPEVFNHDVDDADNTLEGNKPGTVIYRMEGEEEYHEFPPRWYDMYMLLRADEKGKEYLLQLLLSEKDGTADSKQREELAAHRQALLRNAAELVRANPMPDSEELITSFSDQHYSDEHISHKGRMLVDLTRNCYPVPDFVILTAEAFKHREHLPQLLKQAIYYLETMTHHTLGGNHKPLVFAIRCAMPQYIPGLMPTLLNIGVTRVAHQALKETYEDALADRVYLSTLHTVSEMLGIERKYDTHDLSLSIKAQQDRISSIERAIVECRPDGERLITDAYYQALKLLEYVCDFYTLHQDLILTFMQGREAHPSLILQRMVWTIGNNESFPGVLYSRHSRTGKGSQIESYRNIFGEEIMTGDVTSEDMAYTNRDKIKESFPAVYHFHPLLVKLEERYHAPVTIEFAVETRPGRFSLSMFAVLQLNLSEMTGRAALISSIDLLEENRIGEGDVMNIIKPYHLRQIVSAAIDDQSMQRLQHFAHGLSILPRTAITARICFSVGKARELAAQGYQVCLCQERFVPEDTITLNEVHAILSLTPAAIHVVTACRGYGIPALMDLDRHGVKLTKKGGEKLLENGEGLTLREGDKVTLSSRLQTLFKGEADYKPARFTKFLHGEHTDISPEEMPFFNDMKRSYERYQEIVTNQQVSVIDDLDMLARIIRVDLRDKPDIARGMVNRWYNDNAEKYVQQVLESKMGSHQDQSRLFDLLANSHKVDFLRRVCEVCVPARRSGLKAGSFMIGRFVARPIPTAVWNSLTDLQVAFLLNEYVLYEKYLHVLEEVGEIRLARAHSRIETEGIDNMVVKNFDLYTFVPLLESSHYWQNILNGLESIVHQDNTHLLFEKLSLPMDIIFDLTKPWVKAEVERHRLR